jgi:GR25 family glycosyltransferase involved in LPS biosynthesis
MKFYVISLQRTPERLEAFYRVNGNRDRIEHFPAVDGRTLDRRALVEQELIESELAQYTDGAIGCALSHKRLWELAVETGEPVTILEDDAVLNRQFLDGAEATASQSANWDYLQWGWNFDAYLTFLLPGGLSPCVTRFNQTHMRQQVSQFQQEEIAPGFHRLISAFGIPAYTVSPRGAEKLLDWCFPLSAGEVFVRGLERNVPYDGVDTVMNSFFIEPHAQAYVAFPPLVITPNDRSISTIQTQFG